MTWVKGTTTWANLISDLMKVACGEQADGVGTTVAVGDRWVREYDTTINAIRTPASTNVSTGSCSMRAGYWALATADSAGLGYQISCRQTVIRNAMTTRLIYRVRIATANTTSGNYSTASIDVFGWDADTGGLVRQSSFTPNAAGDVSVDGMTFRVTSPSGFLVAGLDFYRMFTPTYLGGIDYWPMYARRAAVVTFQTAPPGTATTDYDIAEEGFLYAYCTNGDSSYSKCQNWTRGNWGTGLGIKTNAGLTGAVYACSFPMALHKINPYPRTDQVGTVGCVMGRITADSSASGVYRPNGCHEVSTWLRPFQTSGSVSASSVISYWMSVKADGIIIVLSGDPGSSGKVTVGWIGNFTPYDTTYDVLPEAYNKGVTDYTGDPSTSTAFDEGYSINYWSMRRKQDGTEGARDWQTKWMRCDVMSLGAGWSGQAYQADMSATFFAWGMNSSQYNNNPAPPIVPSRQLKPHPYDGKWWLYGVAFGDVDPGSIGNTAASPGTMDHRQVRGVVNTRWWFLPGDGWANLDELTDNSNSNKYLLVAADYQGTGGRMKVNTGNFQGGIAIAEV